MNLEQYLTMRKQGMLDAGGPGSGRRPEGGSAGTYTHQTYHNTLADEGYTHNPDFDDHKAETSTYEKRESVPGGGEVHHSVTTRNNRGDKSAWSHQVKYVAPNGLASKKIAYGSGNKGLVDRLADVSHVSSRKDLGSLGTTGRYDRV